MQPGFSATQGATQIRPGDVGPIWTVLGRLRAGLGPVWARFRAETVPFLTQKITDSVTIGPGLRGTRGRTGCHLRAVFALVGRALVAAAGGVLLGTVLPRSWWGVTNPNARRVLAGRRSGRVARWRQRWGRGVVPALHFGLPFSFLGFNYFWFAFPRP